MTAPPVVTIERVLVAKNANGVYFTLDTTYATTTPGTTIDPNQARKIAPWHESEFANPQPAPYYFETSGRMRGWLEGFRMVPVEIIHISREL